MNKILLLIICLPLTFICAQQNTIVSLENDNVWIYETNYYQTIDTIQNFASYCTVFKIIGDTSILGKQVKIIGITEYDSSKKNTNNDYWFSNNSIFQMNNGYSSIALVTFYDKNRLIDSSWSHSGMGGIIVMVQ